MVPPTPLPPRWPPGRCRLCRGLLAPLPVGALRCMLLFSYNHGALWVALDAHARVCSVLFPSLSSQVPARAHNPPSPMIHLTFHIYNPFPSPTRETHPDKRELALVTASIADTLGIMASDVAGLVIQGCLYRANGLEGATFRCGA